MAERTITVEVVYAASDTRVVRRRLEIPLGSTVLQAIDASGIAAVLPEGAIEPGRLGVFARKAAPDQIVGQGDRIEIYRPLTLDPMEARRRRSGQA